MLQFSLLNFFLFLSTTQPVAGELRFVFEHFRHGSRSPTYGLDGNYFGELFKRQWNGRGELTKRGMREHYLLGQRNKIRYRNFLPLEFDPKDIVIFSTDYNRTIMSAFAQLQGMYPDFLFQEIPPLHFFDPFRIFRSVDGCPAVDKMIAQNRKKQVVTTFMKEFNETYGNQLIQAIGENRSAFVFEYDTLVSFCDSFLCLYTDDRNMSEFEEKGINLHELNKSCSEFLQMDNFEIIYGDIEKNAARVVISSTMLNLLDWMDTRISIDAQGEKCNDCSCPKFILYSGHDSTVGAMESFMEGAFGISTFPVPFASNAFFELHRRENVIFEDLTENEYYVVYMYNDHILLNMTYIEFKTKVSSFAMDSQTISDYCRTDSINYIFIATIALGLIESILLFWVILLIDNQTTFN